MTDVFTYNDLFASGVLRTTINAAVERAGLWRQAAQLLDCAARRRTSSRAVIEAPAFLQIRELPASPATHPDFRDHVAGRVTGPEPA
jgi:hypothetical protein